MEILAIIFTIFKWLGTILLVLVSLGLPIFAFLVIAFICTDDFEYEDNSDGHVTCDITDEPCIKSEVCIGTCTNCPIYQENEQK